MKSLNNVVHVLFLMAAIGGVAFYLLSERPADKQSKGTERTYAQQAEADLRRRLDDIQQDQAAALQRSIEIGQHATRR